MAVLRKIRGRIKKIITKAKRQKTKVVTVKRKKPALAQVAKREAVFGLQETRVGQAKFSTPAAFTYREAPRRVEELPGSYGKDKIVLMVRDPWWLYAYWEVISQTWEKLSRRYGDAFNSAKVVLRVYDISQIIFNGANAHRWFDIEVGFGANNWYIDTAGPGRSWCVDIGIRLLNGEFIMIARSNTVHAPLEGPSWITDEEWMIPEDIFARLYGMGFGFGRSSPVGKAWQERMRRALFSGVLASPGMASPVKKKLPKERKFWLKVHTELIVYGATEPDAQVKVQGKKISLRPDGTFSMRFALDDGRQEIPVEAVAADKLEARTITPIVTKETK
jgi:uncharacterized protein